MNLEDTFVELVEVLIGDRAESVEDLSHGFSSIGVRIGSIPSGHQLPTPAVAVFSEIVLVVMSVSEYEPSVFGQFSKEFGSDLAVVFIGGRQAGGHRKPEVRDGDRQVELPTVNPAVPTALRPVGFGINGGMRDHSLLSVFLMPNAALSGKCRAVTSDCSTVFLPRMQKFDEEAT